MFSDDRQPKLTLPYILKVFVVYSHDGHFGQVTLTIYTNFRSPSVKFDFDRLCGCREDVKIL